MPSTAYSSPFSPPATPRSLTAVRPPALTTRQKFSQQHMSDVATSTATPGATPEETHVAPGPARSAGLNPLDIVPCPAGIPLYQLLIAQLDITQHEFRSQEIAFLLNISKDQVSWWVRKLFPRQPGDRRQVHRLDFPTVVTLIRCVCRDGRNLDRDLIYTDLLKCGIINEHFPIGNPAVDLAENILAEQRRRLVANARPAPKTSF
jgi:hypothetical protein